MFVFREVSRRGAIFRSLARLSNFVTTLLVPCFYASGFSSELGVDMAAFISFATPAPPFSIISLFECHA